MSEVFPLNDAVAAMANLLVAELRRRADGWQRPSDSAWCVPASSVEAVNATLGLRPGVASEILAERDGWRREKQRPPGRNRYHHPVRCFIAPANKQDW
jgi:hypothetical protein